MKYFVTIAALIVACNSSQNTAPPRAEPSVATALPSAPPPPPQAATPGAPAGLEPAPAGKTAAIAMMLGGDAGALPLRATDPGKSFDARARDRIAPRDHALEKKPRVAPDPFSQPL